MQYKTNQINTRLFNIANIAGKQRMYSQRLSSLLWQYVEGNHELKFKIIEDANAMIYGQETLHKELEKRNMEALLKADLQDEVNSFIDHVKKIVSSSNTLEIQRKLLSDITIHANSELLDKLDNNVDRLIQSFNYEENWYDFLGDLILSFLFVSLVCISIYVFYFLFKLEKNIIKDQKKLEDFEKQSSIIINSIKDYAIFMLDVDGYVKTWSMGGEKIEGYTEGEIIGKHFSIFYTKESLQKKIPQKELEFARKNGSFQTEEWRVHKNGTQLWANVLITAIYDEKKLSGFVKIIQDISEKKKIEALKNEFMSIVSHELRTPLTSIRGSISLLLSGIGENDPIKKENLLRIADKNSTRLMQIVNDILDFEKMRENKMIFNFKILNLCDLIQNAIGLNEMYAQQFNVKILFIQKIQDCFVYVDPDRLIQVLTNLISNAIKFTLDENPVQITMTYINNKFVRVSVANKGIGIPASFKKQIFQRFTQSESTKNVTLTQKGVGLGLAITKMLIEKMKGTIGFESIENLETKFYFDLLVHMPHKSRRKDDKKRGI